MIDWETARGRRDLAAKQEAAHEYLLKLSRGVTRGQLSQALRGSWIGSVPYGYAIRTIKTKEMPAELVKLSKQWRKSLIAKLGINNDYLNRLLSEGREWEDDEQQDDKDFKLLELGDKHLVRVVQRIFKEFTGTGTVERSMNDIANRLNVDHIDSPGCNKRGHQNRWRFDTIKWILQNRAYIGEFVFNRVSRSKYHHISGGERRPGGRKGINPESDWFVIKKHHNAIINSRKMWDDAQTKLALGKVGRPRHTPETNPYLFRPQLLFCGRCGRAMHGQESREFILGKGDSQWTKRITRYECRGKKYHQACDGTNVREDDLLNSLVEYLRSEFILPEDVDLRLWSKAEEGRLTEKDLPVGFSKLRRLLVGQIPKRADTKRTEKEIKQLRAKIDTGRANLLFMKDQKNINVGEESIRAMEQRVEELTIAVQDQPTEQDIITTTRQVLARLFQLSCTNQPKLFRPAARKLLGDMESITVYTAHTGHGNGRRNSLKRCEFRLKSVGVITGKSNPHQPD